MQTWAMRNPELAARALADSLDAAADTWGHSYQARVIRAFATEVHKVRVAIVGLDMLCMMQRLDADDTVSTEGDSSDGPG
jgi:hypothetical protein